MGIELNGRHDAGGGGGEKVPSEQKLVVMEIFASSSPARKS